MIPAESDLVGTYAEAIGALNGYLGIQMNGYVDGEPRHDVLFSMWDDGSTDEDPNLPEHLRAGAVDWDEKTTVNRFGNEGTGVQTYRRGNYWTPGTYVQFITNCRPETTSYTTIENGKTVVHEQHNMLDSDVFFYSTIEDMKESTALSRCQQDRAVSVLVKAGLIDFRRGGACCRRHFRVREEAAGILEDMCGAVKKSSGSLQEISKAPCEKPTNHPVNNLQSALQ